MTPVIHNRTSTASLIKARTCRESETPTRARGLRAPSPRTRRSWLRFSAFCLLNLCWGFSARADLVLANFSNTNLLKVMAVGDSITDDCSINGAWRAPLQPLLETNGFPFTFTGRQASAPSTGFSKVRHEGYCGAVIASPGVFPAHQYADISNCLQKIVPDALAIATNVPSLMLIFIGVNDIGRGRNPYQVATNDISTLLNIVFSNAPSVHVGLAKITTLQNAGLGYSTYAGNVPIYIAMLQKLVNQRRALGQNVFLADMYSAVDLNTMFLGDYLHPNALGLQAMAIEWLARVQSITIRTNRSIQRRSFFDSNNRNA
jgi:lysophospholipase L1-like esterase